MPTEKRFLTYRTVGLAGGEVKSDNLTFSRFVVIEATGAVWARFNDGEEILLDLGFKLNWGETLMHKVTLRNPSESACTVQFICGTGDFEDNRFNVVATRPNQFVQFGDAPTAIVPCAAQSLAPAAVAVFSGVHGSYGYRKAIVIANLDAVENLSLYAGGSSAGGSLSAGVTTGGTYSGGTKCGVVFPGQSIILETKAALAVKNDSSATVAANFLELYYPKWS